MKYYFSNNCYWDSELLKVFRDDVAVKLPDSQTKLLKKLLEENGKFVSHEVLYFAMTGAHPCGGDWKADLSNKFTRKKENDKGLLIRVPEIGDFFENSKSQIGGGYKITVPADNILGAAKDDVSVWNEYENIWHSNKYWETQQKKARFSEKAWLAKKTRQYLQGEQCIWQLVFASSQYAPVKRAIVGSIIDEIENEPGVIVLTGAGGEGKTTILMQL